MTTSDEHCNQVLADHDLNYFYVEYEIFAALTKETVVIKQKQSEKIAQQPIRKEF